MESIKDTKISNKTKDKFSPIIEIIEFTNPVEISGDGEYLYIIEIDPNTNLMKGLLQ